MISRCRAWFLPALLTLMRGLPIGRIAADSSLCGSRGSSLYPHSWVHLPGGWWRTRLSRRSLWRGLCRACCAPRIVLTTVNRSLYFTEPLSSCSLLPWSWLLIGTMTVPLTVCPRGRVVCVRALFAPSACSSGRSRSIITRPISVCTRPSFGTFA